MRVTPGSTIAVQCFTEQSADETLGPWIDVRGCANIVFYVTGTGTTSSGVVTFEEAAPKNIIQEPPVVFGATTSAYFSITTVNASDVDSAKQKAVHITNAAYFLVRARISTVVGGGGSLSVGLVAY